MPATQQAEIGARRVQGRAGQFNENHSQDQNEGWEHNLVVEVGLL